MSNTLITPLGAGAQLSLMTESGQATPVTVGPAASSGFLTGPGLAGSVVEVSTEAGADLQLPAFSTIINIPAMTGDCAYKLLNAGAAAGQTVGFCGPFTGGQLTVTDDADTPLFGLLDPGATWGTAVFDGAQWIRFGSG